MGSKFWQKSHRNLTDIGTEIWKIFFANPAFRDWLHCWLEIGLIYRDTLPKTRFSLASKKQTGFRFDTFTMFKSILNNVKTKTWFPMKFKFASQLNTNLFHAEIQTWFTMKSKFAPRRTGSRFGEVDAALAEERLEPTLGRIIIHCHHLLYYHQCHIFVFTILASWCPPRDHHHHHHHPHHDAHLGQRDDHFHIIHREHPLLPAKLWERVCENIFIGKVTQILFISRCQSHCNL